jgi:hypothetical protein
VRLDVARLPDGAELPSLEAFADEAGLRPSRSRPMRPGTAARRSAGDAVAFWLNPSLAAHIEQAGLFTLAQLIDHINGIGKLWHGSIPPWAPPRQAWSWPGWA